MNVYFSEKFCAGGFFKVDFLYYLLYNAWWRIGLFETVYCLVCLFKRLSLFAHLRDMIIRGGGPLKRTTCQHGRQKMGSPSNPRVNGVKVIMVVVLVADTFNTNNNGTTISAMRFSEELTKRGHKVRVVCCGDPSKSGTHPETGLEIFYVPELKVPVASRFAHKQHTLFARPLKETLKKAIEGADAVHIYQPWPLGSAAQRTAKRLGVPCIAGFHIQPENITYNTGLSWFPPAAHLIYYLLYVFFYRRFAHIHCPSKFIAAQLRAHGYKAHLHVISNGVHPDFSPKEAHNSDENSDDGVYRILMVGRLSPEKRQDIVINSVRRSRYSDRIQLYFAGQGPWEKKLKRMGRKLARPPIFGYYDREGLISLIRSCHLYVHASDIEIEGISCIEAFSCGLVPVISDSRKSATAQFALYPESLFKAGSSASLAERIDYWLENEERRKEAGKAYASYGREYDIAHSVSKIERVYASLNIKRKNEYYHGRIFRLFSRLFYTFIAAPLLFLWTRVVLGVKIKGAKNLRGLRGAALTLCNHVHMLDCTLVGLALFPRKLVFPTLPSNVNSLWPGQIVRLLGGVALPDNVKGLKQFFEEMEFLLINGRVIHFFPEGELIPYDTELRDFKKGAFHLAAQARVPVIPMSISFCEPRGLRRLIRKKPVMVLHIGKPIKPVSTDCKSDTIIRMTAARKQMHRLLKLS